MQQPPDSVTAVLDIGKTNARLVLVDPTGAIVQSRSTETPVSTDGPYPHEDAELLWPFIADALREAASCHRVRALVPVAHGAAGALLGHEGLALPILDYEHDGPEAVSAAYEALRAPFAETFSPALPAGLNLGRQLLWQQHRWPEVVADARAFVALPQYWAWRLSGVAASEVTGFGAHTDLWAPTQRRFSGLVTRAGWHRLMAPLRHAWDVLGPIRPAIAQATGLAPDTPVLCGLHDSNASLLPHLAGRDDPFAMVSTGTWIIVMHVGGDTACLSEAADMLANVDALGRPTPSARFMGGREYAAIASDDAPATTEAAQAVIAAGVLALPAFSAHGGPWRARSGRIMGAVPAMPGARAALASLYAALVTDDLLDRLGVTGPVIADGPFASNAIWLGALAALRAQPVTAATDGGAATGAARLTDWGRASAVPPSAKAAPLAADIHAYRRLWRGAVAQG